MPSHIQLLIPANIRFQLYQSREDIKCENKFAGIPIRIPLISSMADTSKIMHITRKLKSQFANIYASYAITFWTTIFGPRFLPRLFIHKATMKFTAAFSNTPGPVKAFKFTDKDKVCFARWC